MRKKDKENCQKEFRLTHSFPVSFKVFLVQQKPGANFGQVSTRDASKDVMKAFAPYLPNVTSQLAFICSKPTKRNPRKRSARWSKLTPKRRHWRCSGVFIVNFDHISRLFIVSIVDFEQVNVNWDCYALLYGNFPLTFEL